MDSIPLVQIPPNVWVDVYAATGIAVGTELSVNVASTKTSVVGSISATEPVTKDLIIPLPNPSTGLAANIAAGESGFWVRSTTKSALSVQQQ